MFLERPFVSIILSTFPGVWMNVCLHGQILSTWQRHNWARRSQETLCSWTKNDDRVAVVSCKSVAMTTEWSRVRTWACCLCDHIVVSFSESSNAELKCQLKQITFKGIAQHFGTFLLSFWELDENINTTLMYLYSYRLCYCRINKWGNEETPLRCW